MLLTDCLKVNKILHNSAVSSLKKQNKCPDTNKEQVLTLSRSRSEYS